MCRADLLHQVFHERRVRRASYRITSEATAVVHEVQGEGTDVLLARGQQLLGRQRGDDRGVQPARQQAAQRQVDYDLTINDVLKQIPGVLDRLFQVIGV